MTRNRRFLLILAIVLVVAAVVGVTVARAVGGPDLPAMTPAQLLAKVAAEAPKTTALSGEYAFANNILGAQSGPLGNLVAFGVPFLSPEGSGKVAVADGKVNLTLSGGASSMQFVLDGTTLWVYSSVTNTATEYTLPAHPAGTDSGDATAGGTSTTATVPSDPAAAIAQFLEKIAPQATVTVTGQQEVAGRAAYTLVLTPTATNTVFGSARVAIDGETFLPLRGEVYAKGNDTPVLSIGFTSISYAAPAASAFDYTPPAGATIDKQDLSAKLAGMGAASGLPFGGHDEPASGAAEADKHAELTLAEAETEAGFHVLAPATADPVLPFGGAWVMAIPAGLTDTLAAAPTTDSGSASTATPGLDAPGLPDGLGGLTQGLGSFALGFASELKGPVVLQHYGDGFGTIMLAQVAMTGTSTTGSLFGGAGGSNPLTTLPLFSSTNVNGHPALQMATPLGGFLVWEQDGMLLFAGGMVSEADLAGFAASLR